MTTIVFDILHTYYDITQILPRNNILKSKNQIFIMEYKLKRNFNVLNFE